MSNVLNMERRRAQRVPVSMKIEKQGKDSPLGFGYAVNLSEKGLGVDGRALAEGVEMPKAGEVLQLRFKLPGGNLVISAKSRVVRVGVEGAQTWFALEFENLEEDFRTEILSYVSRSAHRP